MNTHHDIDALITKFLCGEASPEEAIFLEDWKSNSKANATYFSEMQQTYGLVHGRSLGKINTKAAWDKVSTSIQTKKPIRFLWPLSAAASLFILFSVLFFLNKKSAVESFVTQKEEQTQTLKDGSVVTMDPNSTLVLDEKFGKAGRKLNLKGKASFKVVHDEQSPFIIQTDDVFIEDIGTEFTVENQPDNDTIFVIVKEGIVRLYDVHGSELIIKAGEKAWYIKSEKLIVTGLDARVVKFDFKDTKLTDIVSLMDDSFDELIVLQPESIGRCKITTQFFDEDLETIVSILAETLDFQYEHVEGTYILKGKPCQ
ncbi:MAG TPA: FecR domain-containing protein [Saprospiraceae bacterium]|nr:FecR domain-containing protein [Saprospiraceae bacterium]